jgi:predicted hydrocarbon binding protein
MSQSIDLPSNALVALTRESLIALRTALFRDVGESAVAPLQEAGYASGQAMYDAFGRWLASRGLASPDALAAAEFSLRATEFFRETGWGGIEVGALDGVATIDSPDWAESDPAYPLDFPGCYYSSGMLADFFGRLAGEPLAAMEVECRSMGAPRCRFLIGSADMLQHIYEEMARGASYEQVATAAG